MKEEQKGELIIEDRVIADEVADEILNQDDKEKRKFLIFLLIFIICLTFLVSSVSFSIISTYHAGSHNNVIESGSVLFSFNEDNHIELINAYPITDYIGKSFTGENQYLDFTVSVGFSKKNKIKNLNYEVALIPLVGNTLDDEYIRVYLTENNKDVLINGNIVNNFSDLKDSLRFVNGKLLLRKEVKDDTISTYRLRLWLSEKYEVTNSSEIFKCKVAVGTYEK